MQEAEKKKWRRKNPKGCPRSRCRKGRHIRQLARAPQPSISPALGSDADTAGPKTLQPTSPTPAALVTVGPTTSITQQVPTTTRPVATAEPPGPSRSPPSSPTESHSFISSCISAIGNGTHPCISSFSELQATVACNGGQRDRVPLWGHHYRIQTYQYQPVKHHCLLRKTKRRHWYR